jgi:hypothetical protein
MRRITYKLHGCARLKGPRARLGGRTIHPIGLIFEINLFSRHIQCSTAHLVTPEQANRKKMPRSGHRRWTQIEGLPSQYHALARALAPQPSNGVDIRGHVITSHGEGGTSVILVPARSWLGLPVMRRHVPSAMRPRPIRSYYWSLSMDQDATGASMTPRRGS